MGQVAQVITRFAPAPTGHLHLGHVVNAIYVWGLARAAQATVLLRIEDHDRQRCRPEFERSILDDLAWLGFRADAAMVRQSERTSIYEAALRRLQAQHLIYACECSRRSGGNARCSGGCGSKQLDAAPGRALRVRLAPEDVRFDDLRHGPQRQRPAEQCGDLVVRDRDGNWSYQFAVTVDDDQQAVTLVVRGDDLLESTGRQIQLARLLGRAVPPRFFHHPLVMKSPTQKLSKSDNDTAIAALRDKGMRAADVLGLAAASVGLIDRARPIDVEAIEEIISA